MGKMIDGVFNFYSLCLTGKTLEEHGYRPKPKKEYRIAPTFMDILLFRWLFKD